MPVELPYAQAESGAHAAPSSGSQSTLSADGPWCAVVWNDPVNLMSYVVFVFQRHFGYSRLQAEELMRQVHEDGRATVSRGSRERVETDVQAMHSYGLQATIERAGQE